MKYKGSMLRRGILAGAMVLAGCGATVAVAAAPAGASNTEMTAVGSFTTFFMMHALFPEVNNINPNAESGQRDARRIASDSETCSGGITYSTVASSLPTARARARRLWPEKRPRARCRRRAGLHRLLPVVIASGAARGDAAEHQH